MAVLELNTLSLDQGDILEIIDNRNGAVERGELYWTNGGIVDQLVHWGYLYKAKLVNDMEVLYLTNSGYNWIKESYGARTF